MANKHKILFVCVHNSARSQMAEAFLKQLAGDRFEAESAGLEPGVLNPNVIEVMNEIGIDISSNKTKAVFDLFKEGRHYHATIAVCDASTAERCPIFPGMVKRIEWSFADPSKFAGTKEEVLAQTRVIRDQIQEQIKNLIIEATDYQFWAQETFTNKI